MRLRACFRFILACVAGGSIAPATAAPALPAPDFGATNARVVIVEDAAATKAFTPQPDIIEAMVRRGVTALTTKTNPVEAWRSLVSTQDIVGLKVYSAPGQHAGTRPAVVAAVVKGLLDTGLPPAHIVIWDKRLEDLKRAGFEELATRLGVGLASSMTAGWDESRFVEMAYLAKLTYGDLEFGNTGKGVGRRSHLTKLLTRQFTKIINLTPLLNHYAAGVTGNLYSLALGSVDNTFRFEDNPPCLATVVPDIVALEEVGDRVALNIVDALYCQYEGQEQVRLQFATVLNQLRFSQDPVALDVLSLHELERQRQAAQMPPLKPNLALYFNAFLVEIGICDLRKIQIEYVR